MKILLASLLLMVSLALTAQQKDTPVQINLKDGSSINAKHFGQLKCGKQGFGENHIFIKGKYLGTVTEVNDYDDIEKIVLEGYKAAPVASVGNEKAVVKVTKKDGITVDIEEAEIFMTCYATGDKYNQLIVQIKNPLTNQVAEKVIPTKDVQSVIFK